MSQKHTKFEVTPAIKLKSGSLPSMMSLTNIPTAAPNPPTHGPKSAANTAGTITWGQKRTPMNLMGTTKENKTPIATYNAAFNAKAAILSVFKL